MGVTTCDPTTLNFPVSASSFREGTWVMSGNSILKNGHSLNEEYGCDLDILSEGDRIGVLRTDYGALHFFINDVDHGPAATGIPNKVYAVVDMYGKCAQVTIMDESIRQNGGGDAQTLRSNERLVFHEKCGGLVKLTNGRRTAERTRPLDEFNNGVVMTNRPIKDDEIFEIRLDELVDKWSGSIEVGVTTHNPTLLDFPPTMTNMRSGTIMMSGCGILTNGKGTRREYGEFNLDDLAVGDRIGLVRKSNGSLHYFINGMDQGIAATDVTPTVWGVVDLYGMAVKVTIIDSSPVRTPVCNNECVPMQLANMEAVSTPDSAAAATVTDQRRNNSFQFYSDDPDIIEEQGDKLLFHPYCGFHASVINGQKTAFRPNAHEDFNYGVVLTNRPLKPNELFEVRIDKMIDKWAGSIEIGVTTHSPTSLEFPPTMTNVRSGTWMMTSNGVMHNGTTVMDEYGQSLDRLKIKDHVGVMRKSDGSLHFFVNHVDQGMAATNVPENVYGVIDLYGQAAEATIVDQSETLSSPEMDSSIATDGDELRFHNFHGNNATVMNNGKTAARPNAAGEFNDAIVMSNRPLKDSELFEVVIERMVDRWSGSIEAGVTLIKPEELKFPATMTDIEYDTWMLSGSAIMQDGTTIRNGYPLDLDCVSVGSRIGMMRTPEGNLHYYLNGVDQGVVCRDLPSGLYAVIDLYGQCAQVTITSGFNSLPTDNNITSVEMDQSLALPVSTEVCHRFSQCCGKNVVIKQNGNIACRTRNFKNALVFSSDPLRYDELFEVKIEQLSLLWSGSLQLGLTTLSITDTTTQNLLPESIEGLTSKPTWVVSGSDVKKNGVVIRENYVPSLDRLQVDNVIGVKRCSDGTMHIYINGEDMGVAASNIPKNVFAVIDLYGQTESVSVVSRALTESNSSYIPTPASLPPAVGKCPCEVDGDQDQDTAEALNLDFHPNHGKNVTLSNQNMSAHRTTSYNHAIVVTRRPLTRNYLLQIKIDKINAKWTSSLMIGILGCNPDRFNFPVTAISIKKSSVIIHTDSVFVCGTKVKQCYGPNLDTLQCGHIVGILIDDDNCLHLYVNDLDQGIAARDIPNPCYGLIDLYGQCEQISLITDQNNSSSIVYQDDREKADLEDVVKEKLTRIPYEPAIICNCEYQNICSRLLAILAIPDGYFSKQYNMCYCETCHKIRGDELYYKRGDPPKEYAVPCGWCRFSLKTPCKSHNLNMFEKWHAAFYGTRLEAVRKILDCGDLHLSSEILSGNNILLAQSFHYSEKTKPDDSLSRQLFLSPTIRYAGSKYFSSRHKFIDPKTKKSHQAQVAFQVWVKPSSYKVGPSSIGSNEQFDPRFSNNEIEWSTKERGSIMLASLLIKVE
uniref:NHR domain-containing protein n=1 Tax=Octopus bimaculoides TaxID=37653 RepID=A0A0L8HEA4_OCTBM